MCQVKRKQDIRAHEFYYYFGALYVIVIIREQIYTPSTSPNIRKFRLLEKRGARFRVFEISRWRKQDNRFPPTYNRPRNRKRLRDINLMAPRGLTWSRAILALRERNLSVEGSLSLSLVSFGRCARNETVLPRG